MRVGKPAFTFSLVHGRSAWLHPNFLSFTDLRWNNVGLLGGRSLLDALQKNTSLVQLEMAGNNIPSDTLKGLGKACVFVTACE